jgi:tRNA G18 (ribose-2'-O)-methylase SpoU
MSAMRYYACMQAGSQMAVLILENIRSAQNVGAIFRAADAIGIQKIYLTGYTPAPVDKFGRPKKEVAKTALGAEKTIPWEALTETAPLIFQLKQDGFAVVAIEKTSGAFDYKTFAAGEKVAFVFGNEVEGVLLSTLTSADLVISIPMRGMKESLNVATTAGIVLFRVLDK